MKKILSMLLSVLMLLYMLYFSVNADYNGVMQNPTVIINTMAPTVDGVIDPAEGYGTEARLDSNTSGYFYSSRSTNTWAELYFACDENGFYFGADIVDGLTLFEPDEYDSIISGFVPSDGTDMIDKCFGWNGDVFGLMIDPLGAMLLGGYQADAHKPAQYLVGMDEQGNAHMYREMLNRGDITDQVVLAGVTTEYGWSVEGYIPWNIIISDISTLTEGNVLLSPEEIVKDGNYIRVAGIYVDRSKDAKTLKTVTVNRFITVPEIMIDKRPGHLGVGDDVKSLGIILQISEACRNGHSWTEWIMSIAPDYRSEGYEYSECRVCGAIRSRYIPMLDIKLKFEDVKEVAWYADAVKYCVSSGIMKGMSETVFSPGTYLTREQFVMLLANYQGIDTKRYEYIPSDFDDVPTERWYSGAITWAVQQGYIKGVAPGVFGLGQPLTRGDMARLLYLFSVDDLGIFDTSAKADLTGYSDYDSIPYWTMEGLQWAVAENIILSTKVDTLTMDARKPVVRAQAAFIMMNYDKYVLRQLGFEE